MSLLGNYDSSILSAGRRIFAGNGIGLSENARALNKQFLSSSNSLMSALGAAADSLNSIEALQMQVNALRSGTPASKLSRALQVERAEVEAEALTVFEDGTRGSEVDVEA